MRARSAAPPGGSRGAAKSRNARRIARIYCSVEIGGTPRELREAFAESLRQAIGRAWAAGRINLGVAEEFIRALPTKGRA
jgi:hypothetical protein